MAWTEYSENLGRHGKQQWESKSRKNWENFKMPKSLKELTCKDMAVFSGFFGLYGIAFLVNEIAQKSKHACYHLSGIKHRLVTEDEDSDAFFPYYERT